MKLLKVTFKKSQKLLAENLHERPPIQNISIAIHSIWKAGYCNRCTELRAREASSFCDFWNMTSCDFTLFYSFFDSSKHRFFLDMLGKEYFCLSVPNFDSFKCFGF